MEVPGYLGYSLLGDKSLEFVRSPRDYIDQQRKTHGDVFKGRILNRPQVFLTSNRAVEDLLLNKSSHFALAYKMYLKELFDGVLVFLEGEEWEESRRLLSTAFSDHSVGQSLEQAKQLIRDCIGELETDKPVNIYKFFKEFSTRLSIQLFLGQNISKEDASEISALMTTHWRGIISVPLPIRIPWSNFKSGYSKALEAKGKLLAVILEKLEEGSSNFVSEVDGAFPEREKAAQHLLLFVSALIPKAISSLLTSAIIELSKSENASWQDRVLHEETDIHHVLLEVQRLWPPFFGGARICTEACEVGGYRIPEGTQVAYISYSANRDSKVFPQPDTFYPDRWTNENAQDMGKVWTFGGGARKCIGKFLCDSILKECFQEVARHYTWALVPGQNLDYKTLPVSRPKQDIQAVFTRRSQTSTT